MRLRRRALLIRLAAVPMPLLLGAACTAAQPGATPAAPPTTAPPAAPPPTAAPTVAPAVIATPTHAPVSVAPTATLVPTGTLAPAAAPQQVLQPTPQCSDADDPTPAQTEGPYFTRNSPERTSLIEPGSRGAKIVLSGFVLSTSCKPIERALLDFWQADDAGQYDNSGYRYRGHQFTDAQGRFTLDTVVPGLYPGRTRHFHVKVQAPGRSVLTTQLYFPDEARNRSDGIYRPELEMQVEDAADRKLAAFNFVVNAG